jgi:hypothetical protein
MDEINPAIIPNHYDLPKTTEAIKVIELGI